MKRELAFDFSRVTEAAALAGYRWLGRGDKNIADNAAVEAMRIMLNKMNIAGEIVIGEGEIDEAPMLYIGEKVGVKADSATVCNVDIAVDPIEGTRMTAMGQSNAVAVLAAGEKGSFLSAPDMYMEKLVCGPGARGVINLEHSLEDNIRAVAKALKKDLNDITLVTLAKPRHQNMISEVHRLGCKVYAIPDGDVAASILTCMPESDVDMLYCVGGAPEGVITGAVIRALGGDMNARLLLRTEVKGADDESQKLAEQERERCKTMGVEPNKILRLNDIAKSDNVVFSATGITKGDLLEGVTRKGNLATSETLLIRGRSRTIRKIQSTHYLERKDDKIKEIVL
ncbi:class II fructose-bisphosphatase [Teredinibacter sp. KSP-S5-2]|uniref:class II fructose-bisphosphatase n=1 Tax=Teredinibacter sp. KSP-S5-2 TaxID=3034506 RepID=UPI002934DA03|nr:class II fructose-bisphosphatase [Teredinibacter sp. KSP-S5-2]WNO10049.1 class II fructose-bisphosphatase [Teredinibacter sp. KSP-S5-2]